MATSYKKTLQTAAEDDTQSRDEAAQQASQMSQSVQKKFGSTQPITASPQQRAAAEGKAKTASYEQREKFLPQAYQTVSDVESASTGVQDQSAQFWADYANNAAKLEEQQRQGASGLDLFLQQSNQEMLQKMQEMDFTSFKNAAQRQDALEKAYRDGNLVDTLLQGAVNHDIRMQDITKVRELIMNTYNELLADFRTDKEIDFARVKADTEATAQNIGSIMSALAMIAGG